LRKLQVVAVLFGVAPYAMAGTASIGTASARGDMRVDSYLVKGNATLFDGSVVETGQASADLRLGKGTEITMATGSRGTLYRDHLVLQQGGSELAASSSFQLDANGLRITPNEPNSRGMVSMKPGNTVEVAVLTGSFGVKSNHGVLLASVRPGRVVSFAMQAGAGSTDFSGKGMISYENGHYYLTTDENVKYEVIGKDLKRYVGTKVQISGSVRPATTPTDGTAGTIIVSSMRINGAATGLSTADILIIGGTSVGAATGIGYALYATNQSTSGASR
jgi:hypothetical protein